MENEKKTDQIEVKIEETSNETSSTPPASSRKRLTSTREQGELLRNKVNENKNKHIREIGRQVPSELSSNERKKEEKVEDKITQKVGGSAISAATGIPKPLAEKAIKLAQKMPLPLSGRILKFLGFSKTIYSNPILRKVVLGFFMVVILTLIFITLLTSSSSNGRVQKYRDSINTYLKEGVVEQDEDENGNPIEQDPSIIEDLKNKFFNTDLYSYLREEGWCKNGIDCFFSDAASFYKSFRKQVDKVQRTGTATNKAEVCSEVGFPDNVDLDVSMLTATFAFNRNDDDYLTHKEDEVYATKLAGFKKEFIGLTNAMAEKVPEVVYKIDVTKEVTVNGKKKKVIHHIITTSKENCSEYGLIWVKNPYNYNGGYCIPPKDKDDIPENVKIKEEKKNCTIISEDHYKDYIVGNGEYYQTPGTYIQGGFSDGSTYKPNQKVEDYIKQVASWASGDMSKSGIYASVTIAQGILEGTHGTSKLTRDFNNHFGMKAPGSSSCPSEFNWSTKKISEGNGVWKGNAVCACAGDGCYWYRAYNNIGESLADHSRNFWATSRYQEKGVLECVQNNLGPEEQIKRIKAAGYATDPDYVSKIMSIIKSYNLTQYDTGTFSGADSYDEKTTQGVCLGAEVEIDANLSYESQKSICIAAGGKWQPNKTSNMVNASYYSGGYLEQYRMDTLEDYLDLTDEKLKIYDAILKEAKDFGSTFGGGWLQGITDINDPTQGDTKNWRQCGMNWSNIPVGTSGRNICEIGCAVTSVAIQIKRSGTAVNIPNFNPGSFVEKMNQIGGFAGGNIKWNAVSQIAPNFIWDSSKNIDMDGMSRGQKLQVVSDYLKDGCYIIMSVKNNGHWVAVTGISSANQDIIISDPGKGATTAWSGYSVEGTRQLRCYHKTD